MQKNQQPVKTYTSDGKRKFKAKVLSSTQSAANQFFSSKATFEKKAQSTDPLQKMRFEKTKESFEDMPSEDIKDVPEPQEHVSRFKKMPKYEPGSAFKPTSEDFQQNDN